MAIRIGTAPVSWGIMEVETAWGQKQQSFGAVLDEMVAAGYAGTELGPWEFMPTDPCRLAGELSRRGLKLIGAFVPIALADPNRYDEGLKAAIGTARLLAECDAPVLVLADAMYAHRMAIAGAVGDRNGLDDARWHAASRLLERIAREAKALGLRTAFHHHAGTYVETPAEINRLLESTDPSLLGICLDTGHYFYGGGNPAEFARSHAERVWHLHLKDISGRVLERARRERVGFLQAVSDGVFCELGTGAVDLRGVIRNFQAGGYDGWAVFEQDVDTTQPGVDPLKAASRSRRYIRDTLGL